MKEFRCVDCGKGTVRLVAKKSCQIEIPTCDQCGAEWYDDTTSRLVDHVLANQKIEEKK